MAKKKLYQGHYCYVCGEIKANEKFSGKGHAKHICKECCKLAPEEKDRKVLKTKLDHLLDYGQLSKQNKEFLNNTLHSKDPIIKEYAENIKNFLYP